MTDTTTNEIEPVQYPERMKVIFTESGLVRLWTAGDVPDSLAGLPVAEYVNAAALTALTAERDGLREALAAIDSLEGEINPNNYDHDDACNLNRAFCEAVCIASAALAGKAGA